MSILDKLLNHPNNEPLDTHYLEGMNSSRHHVFSVYNKYGSLTGANNVLDKRFESNDIEDKQCLGLAAELQFYHTFKDKAQLVPTLDCGDNTDFVGELKGHLVRFDVTTNLLPKKKKWERYLRYKYHYIAVWNKDEGSWSFWVAKKNQQGEFREIRKR